MPELDDAALERRLRAVLKEHLGPLPLDLTVETLHRRREAKGLARRSAGGRGMTLLAAAALLLVGGALAVGAGLFRQAPLVVVATASPDAQVPRDSMAPSATPIPVAGPGGAWIPVGSMRNTPFFHKDAVRLLDGRVFVMEWNGEYDPTAAALYDPVSGTWSAIASMPTRQFGLPPTLLLDGRVLVGDLVEVSNEKVISGSQLFDPATGTWTATGETIDDLGDGPAVVLHDGKVFVHGFLYDPAAGTWTTGKLSKWIQHYGAATLLSDGKVLAAGGFPDSRDRPATDAAGVYDPSTASWTEIASMQAPFGLGMATQLRDGRVLAVERYASSEIYDSATGTWTALPEPTGFVRPEARLLLPDGTAVLTESDGDCTHAALYEPVTGSSTTVSMPWCAGSFTLLLDGTILVTAGSVCDADHMCVPSGSAALYVPAGVPMPQLPVSLSPTTTPDPTVTPVPTPRPTPLPAAAGPVPPNARSWTVTVENRSSAPAALFVANDALQLVGSASPNVVPAGSTRQVTFLFPVDGGWIYVNPRPGEGGALVNADDIGIPGKILIRAEGDAGWLSP